MQMRPPLSIGAALRHHWPEYLMEAWLLGMFMVSAGIFATLLGFPGSPLPRVVMDEGLRRALLGAVMGLTAMVLIYSPWGKRSGAHMNPAVTLTYWRLGKVARWDAVFYILAQFAGGVVGVSIVAVLLGDAFTAPPVHYVATLPGRHGAFAAFAGEFLISALLMSVILRLSNAPRYAMLTGICAGAMVAVYITLEAPISGMSMNPARSFASALPARAWHDLWVYLTAPVLGMQVAAALYVFQRGKQAVACAKLLHPSDQRCIHCGYVPTARGKLVAEPKEASP
jgi:aquaporin Z